MVAQVPSEMFQSLNRAYKRSDDANRLASACEDYVSIPQSGLQAFRLCASTATLPSSVFQSLNRAYKRSDSRPRWRGYYCRHVSIPQSGLQAFRHRGEGLDAWEPGTVSIPQSGLQAFRHNSGTIRMFVQQGFQSLNRAYKRSDDDVIHCHSRYRGVSIPQSGLQAFRPKRCGAMAASSTGFNPSIGLTSVPTADTSRVGPARQLFQSLNRAYKRSDAVASKEPLQRL